MRFREAVLTDADVQWVQARVRQRVLRWFARQGYLDKDEAKDSECRDAQDAKRDIQVPLSPSLVTTADCAPVRPAVGADRVRGGRSLRLPTEPCVRVRTRLLTQD